MNTSNDAKDSNSSLFMTICHETRAIEVTTTHLGSHIKQARTASRLSQRQLAERADLDQAHISLFERDERKPTLDQLLRLAQVLSLPVQWFLTGQTRPGGELKDVAIELYRLGLVDLHVGDVAVPGSFRPPELVAALAVGVPRPEPRLLAAIPALLAWNRWNPVLLEGFGSDPWNGSATIRRSPLQRLAWLADVALTIQRNRGFPGGCAGEDDLCAFLRRLPEPQGVDNLGDLASEEPRLPAWKRWKIAGRAGTLDTFYDRAAELLTLRGA